MKQPSFGKLLSVFLVLISTFTLGGLARAQVLPALYRVTGVASDDTLNVRALPDGDSEDIGDLLPSQVTEVLAFDASGKWGRILWQEGNGWIAVRYLQAIENSSDMPGQLNCGGAEPFWNLDVDFSGALVYDPASGDPAKQPVAFAAFSANSGLSEFGFASADFTGFVRREQCSDGMSDRDYGWSLSLIDARDGGFAAYSGCCMTVINQE